MWVGYISEVGVEQIQKFVIVEFQHVTADAEMELPPGQ